MSIINMGEVLYIVERERGLSKAQETLARIDELPVTITDIDRSCTITAAHIKAQCPMAFADCFTAALAVLKKATIVTGDPEFSRLEAASVVDITWLDTR